MTEFDETKPAADSDEQDDPNNRSPVQRPGTYTFDVRFVAEQEGYEYAARAAVPFILVPKGTDLDEDYSAYLNMQAASSWLVDLVSSDLRRRGWSTLPERCFTYLTRAEALVAVSKPHGEYSDVVVNYGKSVEAILVHITGLRLNLNKFVSLLREQPQKLRMFLAPAAPLEAIVHSLNDVNSLRNRGAHASPARDRSPVTEADIERARNLIFGSNDEPGLLEMLYGYSR